MITVDVSHPNHYITAEGRECKDGIRDMLGRDGYLDYCRGAVLKYIWRYKEKEDPIKDLNKAKQYISMMIEELQRYSIEETGPMKKLLHDRLWEHPGTCVDFECSDRLLTLRRSAANALAEEIERDYIPRSYFENEIKDVISYLIDCGNSDPTGTYYVAADRLEAILEKVN